MKKRTMPIEPDEMPVTPKRPEVKQPTDPVGRQIPEESPENIPLELPEEDKPQTETPDKSNP